MGTKSTHILFDVGVGLTWRESVGALMVDAFVLDGHYFRCITFKDVLVGGPPLFEDLEISPNDFDNYL